MKKWFGILLGLVLIAVPVIAFACPPQLQLNVVAEGSCVGGAPVYSVTATATQSYDGWTLQGITGAPVSTQSYDVTATWTKVNVPGHWHYDWVKHCGRWFCWYEYEKVRYDETTYFTETRNVSGTIPTQNCYVTCSATVPGVTEDVGEPVWGEWVFNQTKGLMERFGTQATNTPLLDSLDPTKVCGGTPGSRDLYDSTKYEYCKTTNVATSEWSAEIWDAETGSYYKTRTLTYTDALDVEHVCKIDTERSDRPVDRCAYNSALPRDSQELQKQGYGLGELWGPDGQYATMYIYPDKDGNLPIGIGVGRQQCVLGWEAIRSGHFGFVYKNCRGEYIWNGVNVTPRPDVLKHGVCARNGACIEQ